MPLLKFHGLMIWSDVFHWCRWSTCGENKVESQRKSCCINFGKAIQTSGATVTSAVQPLYCVGSFQRRLRLGNGTPLQYSCLENPMDGGAWEAAVHGVAKSQTWLNDFTFNFHLHAVDKEMATTPAFWPGESQGWGSLVGCCLWGRTESDTTAVT